MSNNKNAIKDYFGHEILEGDVVLYSNKHGEFEEGVIIAIKRKKKIKLYFYVATE